MHSEKFDGVDWATNTTLHSNETAENHSGSPFLADGFLHNETMRHEYIFDSPAVRLFFYILYTIVFFLCVFGNMVVLLVVHCRMRSMSKFFMGNLAFANFCVGVFCVYQNLSTFLSENWEFGWLMCKMYYFTTTMSHTASILILVVISVERYLAIVNPFRGRRILTRKKLRLTLVAVWLISAAICAPRLYYITTFEAPSHRGTEEDIEVICAPKRTLYNSRTADMVYFVLLFIFPLIIMTILYARIGAVIRKRTAVLQGFQKTPQDVVKGSTESVSHSDNGFAEAPKNSHPTVSFRRNDSDGKCPGNLEAVPGVNERDVRKHQDDGRVLKNFHPYRRKHRSQSSRSCRSVGTVSSRCAVDGTVTSHKLTIGREDQHEKILKSRQTVVRLLLVLVTSFALCNFPYHLRKICQYFLPRYSVQGYFNQIFTPLTFILMYTNCAINPILYAFMSKAFRQSLKECLGLKGWRRGGKRRQNVTIVRRQSV